MTKLEKLRKNLECDVLELKEAWSEFEKERNAIDTNSNSLEKSDRVVILVKLILEVVSKSNDALDGYSVYTAALEKKLKTISKKNDSEGRKNYFNIKVLTGYGLSVTVKNHKLILKNGLDPFSSTPEIEEWFITNLPYEKILNIRIRKSV